MDQSTAKKSRHRHSESIVVRHFGKFDANVPDSTTTSASPFVILSPGALSQETIFPSVIVDDNAGINTSFTAGAETFLLAEAVLDAITPAGRVVFINESCIVRDVKKQQRKSASVVIELVLLTFTHEEEAANDHHETRLDHPTSSRLQKAPDLLGLLLHQAALVVSVLLASHRLARDALALAQAPLPPLLCGVPAHVPHRNLSQF
jgi:hypothetical protein